MKLVISTVLMGLLSTQTFAGIDFPVVPMSVLKEGNKPKQEMRLIPEVEENQNSDAQVTADNKDKVARSDKETKVTTVKYPSKALRAQNGTPSQNKQRTKQQVSAPVSPAPKIPSNGESIEDSRAIIEMTPGVTKIVSIAKGHLNRVVTPFSTPKVMKIDKNTVVDVRDNVLYIATTSNKAVTMFIREEGSEQVALSLTVIPKKIPPRELFLKLPNSYLAGLSTRSNAKAKRWEEGGDYLSKLKTLNRALALNEIPNGYVLREMRRNEPKPLCSQEGFNFDFKKAQIIEGHHLEVVIGKFTNISTKAIEFNESKCLGYQVRSVSAWPEVVLAPGQSSEVYIVRTQGAPVQQRKRRPTLLGGL